MHQYNKKIYKATIAIEVSFYQQQNILSYSTFTLFTQKHGVVSLLKKLTYTVKENSLLARIAAWKLGSRQVAIVFGNTIYLHNTSKGEFLANKKWLRHELKHIEQYKRYGFLRFIVLYLLESIKRGYTNNKFEIEAREAEDDDQIGRH